MLRFFLFLQSIVITIPFQLLFFNFYFEWYKYLFFLFILFFVIYFFVKFIRLKFSSNPCTDLKSLYFTKEVRNIM